MSSLSSDDDGSATSANDLVRRTMDIENGNADSPPPGKLQRFLVKIPMPIRKRKIFPSKEHLASRLVKIIATVATILCIVQFAYIQALKSGFRRVPNDHFDILFGQSIDRKSPEIWDTNRQSFIHKARPVPVHSHNDYWQRIPLFEALGSGCVSVEADVHLRGSELLVGHNSIGLKSDSTLRSMYLKPLQRLVEEQNSDNDGPLRGIFDSAPEQTVILLIDHKSSGPETFTELEKQLQPLRDLDYLTYWNGTERINRPITVVASGNAPFDSVMALDPTHRDIFWDAKLERLPSIDDDFTVDPVVYKYNRSNSYFASTEFRNAILWRYGNWTDHLPETAQGDDIASTQLEQAKARGLLARYWNTPSDPPNVQEIAWRVLVENDIDILNMDDMGIVRARANGWGRSRVLAG